MNIIIRCTKEQQQEIKEKGFTANTPVKWINAGDTISGLKADAFFDLSFNDIHTEANEFINNGSIVFVHGVNCTCREINKPNYIRLNAWKGFLKRSVIELACNNDDLKIKAARVFNELQWKFTWVEDGYGFIAARIIAMIINEAYYTLEQKVSTKEEIDIAMKLGTNYPYGPFEWSRNIGLIHVFNLLQKLFKENKRYIISPLLVQESQQF